MPAHPTSRSSKAAGFLRHALNEPTRPGLRGEVRGTGKGVDGLKLEMIARRCGRMPYSRQRPRIAPNGRVPVRLTTAQRDLFIQAGEIPRELGYALHRAPVKAGKLRASVTRAALETLISVAAKSGSRDREEERALAALVRYLEGLEDRFEGDDEEAEDLAV